MVQTRQPIYIPSIDGTPTLQQQSQHGHTPNRGRPMQRQLASPITHSRTRLIFLDQGPRNIEIVFGGTEVQRSLASVVGDVDVSALLQEEGNGSIAVTDWARGD